MSRSVNRFANRFAVQNLTMYLVVLTGAVSGANLTGVLPGLGDISPAALARGEWWNVFFYSFNVPGSPIKLLFVIYMMHIFGTTLEGDLGHGRYTAFVLLTIAGITLGTLVLPFPIPAYFLELAIMIGCAFALPNMEILLFFILPVRLKWIALFAIGFAVYQAIGLAATYRSALPFVSLVVGMSGVIVFFGISYVRGLQQQAVSRVRVGRLAPKEGAMHTCVVCGVTEVEAPHMDFRYCVDCADHEYCSDHIRAHEHIR